MLYAVIPFLHSVIFLQQFTVQKVHMRILTLVAEAEGKMKAKVVPFINEQRI